MSQHSPQDSLVVSLQVDLQCDHLLYHQESLRVDLPTYLVVCLLKDRQQFRLWSHRANPLWCLAVNHLDIQVASQVLVHQVSQQRSLPSQLVHHQVNLQVNHLASPVQNHPVGHRAVLLDNPQCNLQGTLQVNLLCFHLLDRLYNRVVNRQQLHLDNLVRSLRQVNLVHSLLLYQVVSQRSLQLQVALQKPVTQTHLLGVLR